MAEKEYIAKEFVIDAIEELKTKPMPKALLFDHLTKLIEIFPTENFAPVKHAKWAYCKLHGQSGYYCSECGTGFADINPNAELIAKSHDYCPNCGAKMDGVRENDREGKAD